eukprot:TRINITY_DN2592_c0_g1_i6.p1 TRINITY_DN2592_c0_g1~~TRINITY_DN2592_c0_g1_i6.p1  ORF type:complete len:650 (-),score=125.75 TRINITY_DN2592_c0_g1_i6:80-2029(-)
MIDKDREEGPLRISLSKGLLRFYEGQELTGVFDTSYFRDAHNSSQSPSRSSSSSDYHSTSLMLPSFEGNSSSQKEPFVPPVFGVTFIGTSHGFDPKGTTTGFIIWINGNGVLVDPPVQTAEFLKQNRIQKKYVNKIILTHCHSDHDSGLIRQILEGEKIEVFSTKTVIESYKRKLNAIVGMKDLGSLFTFKQVKIGQVTQIHSACFDFDYSFHVIPTLRFKVSYCGKSISYSSDTFYHPQTFNKLLQDGIINEEREMSLRMFVFDADLIIHEAGIPPIHTPISVLNDLPTATKKKMLVVHTHSIPEFVEKLDVKSGKKKSVPVSGLVIPKCGVRNTIPIEVGHFNSGYAKALKVFQMVCDVFYFRNISPSRLYLIIMSLHQQTYQSGEMIIKQGDVGDAFFIIESGEVEIYESNKLLQVLTWGDYFGEGALNKDKGSIRLASAVARTQCKLLVLHTDKFHEIQEKVSFYNVATPIENDVVKVRTYRSFVQSMVKKSFLFKTMKPEQIENIVALIDQEREYEKGEVIFKQNDAGASLFFIKQGGILLKRSSTGETGLDVEFKHLKAGEIFGEIALITGLPRQATAIATVDSTIVMELTRDSFMSLLDRFPNIHYNFVTVVEQYLQSSTIIDHFLPKSNAISGKHTVASQK